MYCGVPAITLLQIDGFYARKKRLHQIKLGPPQGARETAVRAGNGELQVVIIRRLWKPDFEIVWPLWPRRARELDGPRPRRSLQRAAGWQCVPGVPERSIVPAHKSVPNNTRR